MVKIQRLFAKTNLKIPICMVKASLRIFQQQGLFCWHFSVFGGSVLYLGDFLWYNRKAYKYNVVSIHIHPKGKE